MSKTKKYNHWYEGITESVKMYIPGNNTYRTIQARRARTGTLFILPLIIGFLAFMVRPLIISLQMSMSQVNVGQGVRIADRFNTVTIRSESSGHGFQ